MSKHNDMTRQAKKQGYTALPTGEIIGLRGKKRKLRIVTRKNTSYYHFSVGYGNILVHRFIAYLLFGEAVFQPGIQVRHLNGNSLDNSFENLCLGTQSDNMMDKSQEARTNCALHASQYRRRFSDSEVQSIRETRKAGATYKQICTEFHTSKSTLSYLFNQAAY